jgi:hypothetical protein
MELLGSSLMVAIPADREPLGAAPPQPVQLLREHGAQ